MEKFILHKDKPEVINCQFQIQGATPEQTVVRLCLEFEDNKNLFFYGKINEDGACEVVIPTLKEVSDKGGKLIIEAIVESTYFKVFEAEVELQTPVTVKMESSPAIKKKSAKSTQVKLENIKIEAKGKKAENTQKINETANPFIPKPKSKEKQLTKFEDYLKNKI